MSSLPWREGVRGRGIESNVLKVAYFPFLSRQIASGMVDSEGVLGDRRVSKFLVEFTLSEILRSLRFLRMTRGEGVRMTGRIIKRPDN